MKETIGKKQKTNPRCSLHSSTSSVSKFAIILVAMFVSGCGEPPSDGKLSINGTVTWNGSLIPDGSITVCSAEGAIDAGDIRNGVFTLRTRPGEKFVSIKAEKEIGSPSPTKRIPNPKPLKFQYIPPEWNTASTLKEKVTPETTTLAFEITGNELVPPSDVLKSVVDD
ncbi:MAG TPA: hypothetical protein VNQ76_07475 [Planctomicrobium sp.]|nr:hypothetical protein [Planctomicrobium sp.]